METIEKESVPKGESVATKTQDIENDDNGNQGEDFQDKTMEEMDKKELSRLEKSLERIKNINLYQPEKNEILEIVNQYNDFRVQIEIINSDYEKMFRIELEVNRKYESFKRDFAKIVEDAAWGKKCYYAIPIPDKFNPDCHWDVSWGKIIGEALRKENRENFRLFVNKELSNMIFTLPYDINAYRIDEEQAKNVNEELLKLSRSFASKMVQMFKYISALSTSLRTPLLELFSYKPIDVPQIIDLPSEEELNLDIKLLQCVFNDKGGSIKKLNEKSRIIRKYKRLRFPDEIEKGDYEIFIGKVRELYHDVQDQRRNSESLKKLVYNKSLDGLYKLYDSLKISKSHFFLKKEKITDDGISFDYCERYETMIEKLMKLIEEYLETTIEVKPIPIKEGDNINNLGNINLFEIKDSEDSPSEELKECVSSISETGFAKYDDSGNVVYIAKQAVIFVYRNILSTDNLSN